MSTRDGDTVSVVMPVHGGVDPAHLRRSVESIALQTLPAAEVVVVQDGPLSPAHLEALDEVRAAGTLVNVVLEHSVGPGAAMQAGVEAASGRWVARMDSDDVALPRRLEWQREIVRGGGLDLVGGAMWEFEGSEEHLTALRRPPESHTAILRRVRTNNPFNHPTLLFRRAMALAVGGYRHDLLFLEDYDFVARMLGRGARAVNLRQPLVLFRTGQGPLSRRKARGMFTAERRLQDHLVEYGLVSRQRARINLVARTAYRALPLFAMRRANRVLFLARPDVSSLDRDDQQRLGDGPQGGDSGDGGHPGSVVHRD